MRRGSAAVTLVLSAVCAGCGSWSGFGFRTDGREMPRLRQVLTLEAGTVVADVGAGKGELTFALAREGARRGMSFLPRSTQDACGGFARRSSPPSSTM
jgi:hypothetical protein